MTTRRWRQVLWSALAAVLIVFLAVGSVHRGPAPSRAARAAAIEAQVKCPSCEGISVAQSSAATAEAIRSLVTARIDQGQSDSQIEAFLVGRYGQSILLSPPVGGGVGLVWVVPVAATALALAGLGTFFWRRRQVTATEVSEEDRLLVARAMAEGTAP